MRKNYIIIWVVMLFVLVTVFISIMPLHRINVSKCGITINDENSYLIDVATKNGKVTYECVLSLKNETCENKIVTVKALQIIEFVFGSISSPIMVGYDKYNGSRVIEIASGEEKRCLICFISERGWGPLMKTNRYIPLVVFEPQR